MELIWLEDYLALAQSLSFSRAADTRGVSQPAFSRRIRALEAWVGAPLFIRTTHHVALTPAGEHFRAQAEFLTRALHQLRRDTREVAGRDEAALTIAATHALSFTFFPQWVRRHDGIMALGNLNLISDSLQACEKMMTQGSVQFLLCHFHEGMESQLTTRAFTSVVVGADRLVPVCAPDARGQPRWHLGGSDPVRLLAYSAASGLGRIVAARGQPDHQPVERVFTSHLAATLLSMARDGEGVAWLPRTLIEEDLGAARLVAAADRGFEIPIDIRLFRPVARQGRAAEAAWSALQGAKGP